MAKKNARTVERHKCNQCGEAWDDTGDDICPFCESTDTFIVADTESAKPQRKAKGAK